MSHSRAVVCGGWCFVSGVTGYDYATMAIPDDPAARARNCFATVRAVLGEVLGAIRPAATMVIAGRAGPI